MAARKKLFQTEATREKIRVSALINRLHDHIDGKNELTTTQVRAIEVLLRKSLPDLSDVRMDVNTTPVMFQFNIDKDTDDSE